jgi:hypothetical protein
LDGFHSLTNNPLFVLILQLIARVLP